MSGHEEHVPQPRPVWGVAPNFAAAPAARDTDSGDRPHAADPAVEEYIQWAPITVEPEAGHPQPPSQVGESPFAGTPQDFTPPADASPPVQRPPIPEEPQPTMEPHHSLTQEQASPPLGNLSDLFDETPPAPQHDSAAPLEGSAAEPVAPRREDHFLPERHQADPEPRREDHFLPEHASSVAEDQPAENTSTDLLSVFGDSNEQPAEYANQGEAMAAWREAASQRTQDRPEQPATSAADARLQHRYVNAERLADTVRSVLGLGQSGDLAVQSTLRNFTLTRDAELDAWQRAEYERVMAPVMQANYVTIANPADAATVFDLAYDELIGIGPLGPLWRDDDVTEIMVSGPNKVVVERNGALVKTPVKFHDLEHLRRLARDLAQKVDDRVLSRNIPLVTAQLPGARVQFVMAPVAAVAGVSITMRKFRPLLGLDDLLGYQTLTPQMASFLSDTVSARANILVSGSTGSGKTTMINALSAFVPDDERVVTIEDALELALTNTHVEQLLTKEAASGDDKVIVGQHDLLRATLRMRPDRIIVGEIRDGRGCSTMLEAANTGHDGTMTTVHANNPDLALRRLATLLRKVENMSDEVAKEEVSSAFHVIIQVARTRGRRLVSHISLVDPERPGVTVPLFTGRLDTTGTPVFTKSGGLRSDTELAQRMLDAGLDPSVWS